MVLSNKQKVFIVINRRCKYCINNYDNGHKQMIKPYNKVAVMNIDQNTANSMVYIII